MDDLSEVSGFGDYSGNTDMGDYPQYPDKDTEQMAQGVILGDKINFWVNGVLNMPISVLGIIGNIICIGTLVKHHQSLKFKSAFTKLLVLLSLYYIFSLVFGIVLRGLPGLWIDLRMENIFTILSVNSYPWARIVHTGGFLTMLSIALERYLNICAKVRPTIWHHLWRGWGYVILVIFFSVVFNIHTFFELTTAKVVNHSSERDNREGPHEMVVAKPTDLRLDETYMTTSVILAILRDVGAIIVISVLTYKTCTSGRACEMREQQNVHDTKEEQSSLYRDGAMMSIQVGLVAIFVISKVPEKFLSAYELLHYFISKESAYIQYTGWTVIALPFAELLVSASYALTIFVLCYQDKIFRALLFCK